MSVLHILPQPQEYQSSDLPMNWSESYRFCGNAQAVEASDYLQQWIKNDEAAAHAIYFETDASLKKEEYRLLLQENITIISSCAEGAFRAATSLKQLFLGKEAHQAEIHDFPDVANRGVMVDVSRGKIPKQETLFRIVELLADLKYNQLQLYMEGIVFEYAHFPEAIKDKMPITIAELKQLQEFCKKHFIQLVPNQNGFGHMAAWLALPELNHLGIHDRANDGRGVNTLNPLLPESAELVDTIYSDLLPYFTSDLVNIGMDEPVSLGKGETEEICKQKGEAAVYVEYLNKMIDFAKNKYGKTAMFWDDIVFHHPESLSEVRPGTIVLDWGYEQEMPYMDRCRILQEKGLRFYTCPGTSTWGNLTGRFDNMIYNIESAVKACIVYGGEGVLLTDWGDGGHPHFLAMSILPYIFGGCCMWNFNIRQKKQAYNHITYDKQVNIIRFCEEYVDRFVIGQPGMGRLLHQAANYYELENRERWNGTYLLEDVNHVRKGEPCRLDDATVLSIQDYMTFLMEQLSRYPAETPYLAETKCDCALVLLFAEYILNHGAKNQALKEKFSAAKEQFINQWKIDNRAVGCNIFTDRLQTLSEIL